MFLIGKRSPFLGEMKNSVVTIRAATARLRVVGVVFVFFRGVLC